MRRFFFKIYTFRFKNKACLAAKVLERLRGLPKLSHIDFLSQSQLDGEFRVRIVLDF